MCFVQFYVRKSYKTSQTVTLLWKVEENMDLSCIHLAEHGISKQSEFSKIDIYMVD